jgi:hypothetical protein
MNRKTTVIEIQDDYITKLSRLDFAGPNYYNLQSRYGAEARKALRNQCGFSPEHADRAIRDAYDIFRLEHPYLYDSCNKAREVRK